MYDVSEIMYGLVYFQIGADLLPCSARQKDQCDSDN